MRIPLPLISETELPYQLLLPCQPPTPTLRRIPESPYRPHTSPEAAVILEMPFTSQTLHSGGSSTLEEDTRQGHRKGLEYFQQRSEFWGCILNPNVQF